METIKIQNKRTGEIDELVVPQGMKPDEFKNQVLNKTFTGSIQKVRSEKKPVESQKTRSLAQGLTFGFADEAEAAIRSVFSDDSYKDIRNNIRKQLADYQRENGAEALALEMAGSTIPSFVSMFIPALGQTATAANVSRLATLGNKLKQAAVSPNLSTLAKQAKVGTIEGGIAGIGYSDKEDVSDIGMDALTGAGIGTVMSPAVSKGSELLGRGGSNLYGGIKAYLQGKPSASRVEKIIQKEAADAGLEPEEFLEEVANGRVMSDNETIRILLREVTSRNPQALREAATSYTRRAREKGDELTDALRRDVGDTYDPNLTALESATRKSEEESASELYNLARNAGKDPSPILIDFMQTKLANPRIAKEIMDRYDGNLVPPFQIKENGAVEFIRMPTMEDAEIMKRTLASMDNMENRAGRGDLAQTYRNDKNVIQDLIERQVPEYGDARRNFRSMKQQQEAYTRGVKAPALSREQITGTETLDFDKMTPQEQQRYGQGAALTLMGKGREDRDLMALSRMTAADSVTELGQKTPARSLIEMISPNSSVPEASRAYRDIRLSQAALPTKGGSQTAPMLARGGQLDDRASAAIDLGGAVMTGDATGVMIGATTQAIKQKLSAKLTDDEILDLTRILISEDPDQIYKVLTSGLENKEIQEEIARLAEPYIQRMKAAGSRIGSTQAGQIGAQ